MNIDNLTVTKYGTDGHRDTPEATGVASPTDLNNYGIPSNSANRTIIKNYIGNKVGTRTIDGTSVDVFQFIDDNSVTYPLLLKNYNYFLLKTNNGKFYSHQGTKFTYQNTFPRLTLIETIYNPFNPMKVIFSQNNYLVPKYQRVGWITFNSRIYLLWEEVTNSIMWYEFGTKTIEPLIFENYQRVTFTTFSIGYSVYTFTFTSSGVTALIQNTSQTFSSYSALDNAVNIEDDPKESYTEAGEYTFVPTKGVTKTTGNYFGKYFSAVDENGNILDSFNDCSLDIFSNFSFTIEIQNTVVSSYELSLNGAKPKIYVGKSIKLNNIVSDAFQVYEYFENDFMNGQQLIEQTLDTTNLYNDIYSTNTNIVIYYHYYDENDNLHNLSYDLEMYGTDLAVGNSKFQALTVDTSNFHTGNTIRRSDYVSLLGGYLTYSDGATIALSNVAGTITATDNLSSIQGDEIELDPSIHSITITWTLATTYFGNLTFTRDIYLDYQDYPVRGVFRNAKVNYQANDVIELGSGAVLDLYNEEDTLIKTVSNNELNDYITSFPSNYGSVISKASFKDSATTFTYRILNRFNVTVDVNVTYFEDNLIIDTGTAEIEYCYKNDALVPTFSASGITITARKHTNTNVSPYHSITTETISLGNCSVTTPVVNHLTGEKYYNVVVTYTGLYQTLSGTYLVNIYIYEPESLVISGDTDSTKYYNNNVDTFHIPTGLTFKTKYSDGSYETLTISASRFNFYRDSELTALLEVGSSLIKESDGSAIYVYDTVTQFVSSYQIAFQEDTISSIDLDDTVTFILGNRPSKYKNDFVVVATYSSSVTKVISNYTFVDDSILLASATIKIIINGTEYSLPSGKITFTAPSVDSVTLLKTNNISFKTTYNNLSDTINCAEITLTVHYTGAEYTYSCTYTGNVSPTANQFIVSSTDLENYVFDGTELLNVDMNGDSSVTATLVFTYINPFTSSSTTYSLNVAIVEITEITGISILSTYTDYSVGDTFLNDNDNTRINVFYKGTDNLIHSIVMLLRQGLMGLNINPIKGTLLKKIETNKIVKITASNNINVSADYAINVGARYTYNETQEHSIVAVKTQVNGFNSILINGVSISTGQYKLPISSGYIYLLVDRFDSSNNATTEINNSGARVYKANKYPFSNIEVYGYLDDIFSTDKSARVVLFNDYISPNTSTNNIDVTFPCYNEDSAERINKCRFGILFGNNNAKNRLFVSGNKDIPNCDWHSGNIATENLDSGNFGYFEDTSYCFYGESDNKIIGYDIVSNDKLLVLKDYSDKETTIYFRTPTLVSAINGSGTKVTDVEGNGLYQEEFALVKGNNSVAGINAHTIVNLNGDTLFLSSDKSLVGLDLTGIVGDNQRYANSRSYYIDRELAKEDLTKAYVWTNNKYLLICLEDKVYLTHYETKIDLQYEWWVMNIKDVQCLLENNGILYFANSSGSIFKFTNNYVDKTKIFLGLGGSMSISDSYGDDKIVASSTIIEKLDIDKTYYFRIIPTTNEDEQYIYYNLGDISNTHINSYDFKIRTDNGLNALELVAYTNGVKSQGRFNYIVSILRENEPVYLNHKANENDISASAGSPFDYYTKYYLKRFESDSFIGGDLYKLYNEQGVEMPLSKLNSASLCYKATGEYLITQIDRINNTFKLSYNEQLLDIVRYANQAISRQIKSEIILKENVFSYYITKPYTMGDLNYFKTIWQWTLTNDTNMPSVVDVCVASNKIPYEYAKTLATINADNFGISFDDLNFYFVDFDKTVIPRTYTTQRVLDRQKFTCFAFKNYGDTNSILSSMSIVYSVTIQSYSGN